MRLAPLAGMSLQHRQVQVRGRSIHVVEGGATHERAVLCLHGWPESSASFERLLVELSNDWHAIAIDLPGIGQSEALPISGSKRELAAFVADLISTLRVRVAALVGHDAGGQIVYAYLHDHPDELAGAAILNVAIPGVDPWEEIKRIPQIWHFAFHSIPELPEQLVSGKEAEYFDYFYDRLSARPGGVPLAAREKYRLAYAQREALTAGFNWYRAFPQDEKDNAKTLGNAVHTPVLYVRGSADSGLDMARYERGLRAAGLRHLSTHVIENCGHFSPDEQPAALADALREFLQPASLGRSLDEREPAPQNLDGDTRPTLR